jgi:sugar lactone lactonase YvrE
MVVARLSAAHFKASQGGAGERQFSTDILDPNQGWEQVGKGYDFAKGMAMNPQGDVFFCDSASSKIYKISAEGENV